MDYTENPGVLTEKKNDELMAGNSLLKSWSENQRTSMACLNILLFIEATRLFLLNLNVKLSCIEC